jgi:hypothetical protein
MPTDYEDWSLRYSGKSVSQLKADVLSRLRQPALNYDRYTEANILSALNDAQLEVTLRTKCLRTYAIMVLKEDYAQYAPPSQLLSPINARFYTTATQYIDLKIKSRAWLDKYSSGWASVTGSQPQILWPGDSYGSLRKIGVYPIPSADGTVVTVTPGEGEVISGTGLTTSGNITGRNTTPSATVCVDESARTLANLGVKVGMIALNVTDGSSGQISDVTATTFTVTLAGGSDNTWAVADSFAILAGEYGVITGLSISDEQFLFSSEVGVTASASSVINNIFLNFYRRPVPLLYDTQFSEIPIELHSYLPEYAIWLLRRGGPRGSTDFQEAAAAIQIFDRKIPPISYRSLDDSITSSTIQYNW